MTDVCCGGLPAMKTSWLYSPCSANRRSPSQALPSVCRAPSAFFEESPEQLSWRCSAALRSDCSPCLVLPDCFRSRLLLPPRSDSLCSRCHSCQVLERASGCVHFGPVVGQLTLCQGRLSDCQFKRNERKLKSIYGLLTPTSAPTCLDPDCSLSP